ncbi:ATP-binding protein [Desulfospira joergensenii]|uniref:ATP-binding protein n=1 Tax=Desulfospira joergensenii TaxID=53329 RepID=UPI0003B5CBBD|nr:ATP-binding protein [Desulfospira joergensenii]
MKTGLKKRVRHLLGRAVHDWSMISEKDRILVGISGGVDSQTLLTLLGSLQKRSPVKFDLLPVFLDPGFEPSPAPRLEQYVKEHFGAMVTEYTDYGTLAHSEENRENPCFLCSRLRRKRLFEIARDSGCKKIALGHNKDDIIETLFINMFYAGKIGTMKPRQSFFKGRLDIIRPLSYVDKEDIVTFSRMFQIPKFGNPCPSSKNTKRGEVRNMLETMYKQNKHIKGNIFRSMGNVAHDYLLGNE